MRVRGALKPNMSDAELVAQTPFRGSGVPGLDTARHVRTGRYCVGIPLVGLCGAAQRAFSAFSLVVFSPLLRSIEFAGQLLGAGLSPIPRRVVFPTQR
jgi:hypothetical protein